MKKENKDTTIITGEIDTISNYNEGYFSIMTRKGQHLRCKLVDDRNWDKLYDYLMRPITLEVVNGPDGAFRDSGPYWVIIKEGDR